MAKRKDITGQVFNRLTAISGTNDKNQHGSYIWNFSCDCGNNFKCNISDVASGNTKSCGCLSKEILSTMHVTHGMSYTTEYKSWSKIMERCFDENCPEYAKYGAIGIVAQESWKDFKNFIEHIGPKPKDGNNYSVDRILNSLGYVEGNVRWATTHQQARNKGMYANNKSGVAGVYWKVQKHPSTDNTTLYAVAHWYALDGKSKSKFFSTKKFGKDGAFKLACELRLKMIQELNEQGAGYAELHGK